MSSSSRVEAAREAGDGKVPVIACVSFDEARHHGRRPRSPSRSPSCWPSLQADAIGVNCATGPAGVFEMVTRMQGPGLPLVAIPNAGMPQQIEGRFAYMATPEYFQLYARRLFKAGVHGVGGCCGTTPEHIRKIVAAARMVAGGSRPSTQEVSGGGMREDAGPARQVRSRPACSVVETARQGRPSAQSSAKVRGLGGGQPAARACRSRRRSRAHARSKRAASTSSTWPTARAPRRAWATSRCACASRRRSGLPALMHVTSRDRNLLGQVAYLLAAHELGVRNLVVITGDPPKMGDFPTRPRSTTPTRSACCAW